MTLFSHPSSVLDQTWVSLDLETTGLDYNRDEIIEVGAVKFQGQDVLDTYQTLVNPYKQLSEFVKDYTSITQRDVDRAPPFAVVAGELASFVGSHPLLGHNVAFDLGFLEKKGLRLTNPRSDTWDLAFVLLPETPDYSLSLLAEALEAAHEFLELGVGDEAALGFFVLRTVLEGGEGDDGGRGADLGLPVGDDLDAVLLEEGDRLPAKLVEIGHLARHDVVGAKGINHG